jgi:hypothetical protein
MASRPRPVPACSWWVAHWAVVMKAHRAGGFRFPSPARGRTLHGKVREDGQHISAHDSPPSARPLRRPGRCLGVWPTRTTRRSCQPV